MTTPNPEVTTEWQEALPPEELAARRAASSKRIKRNWLIALGVLGAAWAYTGFMGPMTLLNGTMASNECVSFAKKKNVLSGNVYATNLRIRHSSWVVDVIGQSDGYGYRKGNIESRTCVVDGEFIKLVGLLEAPMWR